MYISENQPSCLSHNQARVIIKSATLISLPHIVLVTVVCCLDFVISGANIAAILSGKMHGERMRCDSGIDVEKLSIDASKFGVRGWVGDA
jgi:hypothetical protein